MTILNVQRPFKGIHLPKIPVINGYMVQVDLSIPWIFWRIKQHFGFKSLFLINLCVLITEEGESSDVT